MLQRVDKNVYLLDGYRVEKKTVVTQSLDRDMDYHQIKRLSALENRIKFKKFSSLFHWSFESSMNYIVITKICFKEKCSSAGISSYARKHSPTRTTVKSHYETSVVR